jgi:hypothetical protein
MRGKVIEESDEVSLEKYRGIRFGIGGDIEGSRVW